LEYSVDRANHPSYFHPQSLMLSVYIALGTLILVLPISGLLWFWFVRSQD
jgi:protein-S-isoprenylcysteine O-methyltransferase Ste14